MIVAAPLALPACSHAGSCLSYGGPVTVTGVLVSRTYPGPPNYESVDDGDRPEAALIVRLDPPACVEAEAGGDGFDIGADRVDEMQIVPRDDGEFREMASRVGQPLRLKGWLFGAQSGHHHTPILLERIIVEGQP